MNRNNLAGLWISWPYSFSDTRGEFDLQKNGRFKVVLFNSGRDDVSASAEGSWDVIGDVLQWTYETTKGFPRPRKPERDKILKLEKDLFVLLGSSEIPTSHWRGVPCDDASTNFDLDEVRPFLKKLVKLIDAGFGDREVAAAMRKIRSLKVEKRLQLIFPITFRGENCPFYIGVEMDDTDAPDICFSGPVELVRLIDEEIGKLDEGNKG